MCFRLGENKTAKSEARTDDGDSATRETAKIAVSDNSDGSSDDVQDDDRNYQQPQIGKRTVVTPAVDSSHSFISSLLRIRRTDSFINRLAQTRSPTGIGRTAETKVPTSKDDHQRCPDQRSEETRTGRRAHEVGHQGMDSQGFCGGAESHSVGSQEKGPDDTTEESGAHGNCKTEAGGSTSTVSTSRTWGPRNNDSGTTDPRDQEEGNGNNAASNDSKRAGSTEQPRHTLETSVGDATVPRSSVSKHGTTDVRRGDSSDAAREYALRDTGAADRALRKVQGSSLRDGGNTGTQLLRMGDHDVRDRGRGQLRAEALCNVSSASGIRGSPDSCACSGSEHRRLGRCRAGGGNAMSVVKHPADYGEHGIQGSHASLIANDQSKEVEPMSKIFLDKAYEDFESAEVLTKHMPKLLVLLGPETETALEKNAVAQGFRVQRFSLEYLRHNIMSTIRFVEKHPGCDVWAQFSGAPWSADLMAQIKNSGGVTPGWVFRMRREIMAGIGVFRKMARSATWNRGTATIEWARGCPAWNTPEMTDLLHTIKFRNVMCDGCCFGAKNEAGQWVKQAWRMETTCETLFQNLHGQRCEGKHYHGPGDSLLELSRMTSVAIKSLSRDGNKRSKTWKDSVPLFWQLCEVADEEKKEPEDQGPEKDVHEVKLTTEELGAWDRLDKRERERLTREAAKVHANASHKPARVLADGLRMAGAKPEVVAAMKQLKCDTCSEREVHAPRPPCAFLDQTARHPWEILGIDVKEDTDVAAQEKTKYLVMIDEVMKLTRVVEIFTIGSKEHRNATTQELLKAYHEGWAEIFGDPRVLRHDAESALMGTEFTAQLAGKGIKLDPIAGEAHWQLGVPERVIKTIFETADQVQKDTGCDRKEAVRRSTAAHNHVADAYGYTPSQWAFGRQPNWYGTLWSPEDPERPPLSKVAGQEFQQGLDRQRKAEDIMRKAISQKELTHAKNAKYRRGQVFKPGDLVFAWRQARRDRAADRRSHPSKNSVGVNSGQWYGPGTILGTETITIRDTKMPGSIVWVIMNGRLWRCAPSQLRPASSLEAAAQQMNRKATWTFEDIVGSIDLGQYIDVREEGAPPEDGTLDEEIAQPGIPPHENPTTVEEVPATDTQVETPGTSSMEPAKQQDQDMSIPEVEATESSSRTDSVMPKEEPSGPSRQTLRQRYRKPQTKALENQRYREKKKLERQLGKEKQKKEDGKRARDTASSTSQRRMTRKTPYGASKVYFQAEKEDVADPDTLSAEACLMALEQFHVPEDLNLVVVSFPELDADEEDGWSEVAERADCYLVNNLKKGRAEINERKATADERKLIQKAKGSEIEEFLKEKVVEHLQEKELKTIPPEDVMKMRFVLTWKADPESPGGKRAKARLVVLGFQDPHLGKEDTLAPTMHKRSRMLLLANAAQRGWIVEKADVKAAFLQGKAFEKEETRYALPPQELAEAMGMDLNDIRPVRLCKSVYGLTRAPLDWYKKVDELLISLGGLRSKADPCIWYFHARDKHGHIVYEDDTVDPTTNVVTPRKKVGEEESMTVQSTEVQVPEVETVSEDSDDEIRSECSSTCSTAADTRKAELIGSVGAHVDDFLLGGDDTSSRWPYIKKQIWNAFRWTPWEKYEFKQTGTQIHQNAKTKAFLLDQKEYLDTVEEIEISTVRKKTPDAKSTPKERTQLKGILGALLWLATQTRMDICAEVGLLQSCACEERALVKHLLQANALLRRAKKVTEKTMLKLRKLQGPLCVAGWTDASLQNRIDQGSTGGYLIGLTTKDILEGQQRTVNPISWRSFKLRRVAVSSLSAETQALRTMEDEMHIVRLMWAEFEGQIVVLADHDAHVKTVPGIAIIDAKAIYDALAGKTQALGLVEKRTGIELQAYKDDTERNGTITRWVHGEANLADGFTKIGAEGRLITFSGEKDFVWTIIDDEEARSAKKRRQQKLGVFDTTKKSESVEEDFETLLARALSGQKPDWQRFQGREPDDDPWFDMAHFTEGC